MNQQERRVYLLQALLAEDARYREIAIPDAEAEQKELLRALFNVRMPKRVGRAFLEVQDAYLQEEIRQKGITDVGELTPFWKGVYLWQGDITTLRCDAIVNAANAQMLGCFCPNHGCIDNAIHTFAGVQLRAACARIMEHKGCEAKTGGAEITPGYNLPSRYVLHTVGPIIHEQPTGRDEEALAACYRSCLELAEKNRICSIAFCCISTGEFRFPNERAAEIAIRTVWAYRARTHSDMKVIFNVFRRIDFDIYRKCLDAAGAPEG